MDDQGIRASIEKTWETIESQIEQNWPTYYQNKNLDGSTIPRTLTSTASKSTKCIRVFVSSTFTDFYCEREALVKRVFPKLREWCAVRNLDLIECDLRWGVPKDSTSDDTILACMSELDRCYEQNDGQPFFIGMLSERYILLYNYLHSN